MNYYRRYVGDYLRDTSRLSMLEHGAYNLLLDYYYAEERPIPADMTEVFRMVRAVMPEERRAVQKVLTTYFEKRDDGWHQKRVDKEIETSRTARSNGSKGGRPKTGEVTENETGTLTGLETEDGGGSGHPPTSNHQPPTGQPPEASHQPKKHSAAARGGNGQDSAERTRPTRQAYSDAYERRWGVKPVLDRQANSMIKQFVEKLGVEESPGVAAFYVTHNRQDYYRSKHDVALMLRDARGLRTEWATQQQVTDTQARQTDRTAATAGVVSELLHEHGHRP